MQKPKSPCKGCDDRQVGCHVRCRRYAAFRQDNEAYRQLVAKGNRMDDKVKYCNSRISRMYK